MTDYRAMTTAALIDATSRESIAGRVKITLVLLQRAKRGDIAAQVALFGKKVYNRSNENEQ